ncbi:putative opioid growth factor receptor (OGFr) conserved region [Lyophyllum shimeji]|uniref:Opioid growth factor receptor (OGFr) conserved region n=1 Tax=Lyophyllum shimeji TaxID=47721 RepID=A0A9P3UPL7_LYOSH|nr:putative opioid growth factor receptor (OGFr) conserved region [Lyophyllum shimeji]
MSIPRDIREFLEGYPDATDDPNASANLEFYSNRRRCRPDNRLIDEIHEQWTGNYSKLESKHGYIQWLFPIQEYGMNYQSQPLQRHEIQAMKADPTIIGRITTSYEMMLDFYGMRLVSADSGLVDRSLPPRNYVSNYKNLVRSSHNNLRISRILKCLSEFGLEHLNVGFLLHVLCEQSESDNLNTPGIRSSMDRWWTNCIRNDEERRRVADLIRKVRAGTDGYVFTRDMYNAAIAKADGVTEMVGGVIESIDAAAGKATDVAVQPAA